MQEYMAFAAKHIFLTAGIVVVAALIVVEELKHFTSGSVRVKVAGAIKMMNEDNATVLDIRTSEAYSDGHIVGAINVPASDLKEKIDTLEKHKNNLVIVVCARGHEANAAMMLLRKAGFSALRILVGGMGAWKEAELPVTKQ